MNSTVRLLTAIATCFIAAGTALLGAGLLMLVNQRPHTGANIGAGGAVLFGQAITVGGLLIGGAAVVAWFRARKREPRPAAGLPVRQKLLRYLTVAAVVLLAAGAVVESVAAFTFGRITPLSDLSLSYAIFVVGFGLVAVGLLAGIAPAWHWWSRRRAAAGR
ncbi:hypothetical protein CU254_17005 [Amycolatopsis sp. AA4]|uniref:hypothetical protein n=1 Tax=Actinomycetes TaxID=1760 RepID=UPI0001B53A72|nr:MULTISPECIES: hypothetical protein [Actinomycetes]ATY11972.1 hypothetical protein CU254_17005 [Amycolatopsis sp. AA4]EFL07671.1 predicted protein [Streptomyces sp. AA4]